MHRIACVVGTRPEAIKMAPLVRLLKEDGRFAVTVLASGQHSDMLLPKIGRASCRERV